jgi:hypothetical protein
MDDETEGLSDHRFMYHSYSSWNYLANSQWCLISKHNMGCSDQVGKEAAL